LKNANEHIEFLSTLQGVESQKFGGEKPSNNLLVTPKKGIAI
jgi:hypothetical protein